MALFQQLLDEEWLQFDQKCGDDLAQGLQDNHLKLVCAESVTGGQVAKTIVDRPGCSAYFLGGIIAYDSGIKIRNCGVKPKTIREFGAVSEEVAREMSEGVALAMNADVSIATTGVAGPPNEVYGPGMVGNVFIGITVKNKTRVKKFNFKGSRQVVIGDATRAALGLCRDYVKLLERS